MPDKQKLLNFLNAVRSFCSLLETKQSGSPAKFLTVMQRHLLTLYSYGLDMPLVKLEESTNSEFEMPDVEMESVLRLTGENLPYQYYWHVFDPSDDKDTTAVCGDMVDDIGDIYKDIKRSLLLFDSGSQTVQQHAVWQFKFDFENHWSNHCINALYAIHYFQQRLSQTYK